VLIAAAACEMHPAAVQAAAERPSLQRQLLACTADAAKQGVGDVPAILIGARVFAGERALEQAAAHMRAAAGAQATASSAAAAAPAGGR